MNLVNNDEKWLYLNKACDNGNLTVQELGLYAYLLRRINHEKGYAYPTYEEMMNNLNITSRNTLAKYIKALETKGYITKKKEGMGLATSYYFSHYNSIKNDTIIKEKNSTKINNFKNKEVSKNDIINSTDFDTKTVSKNDTTSVSNFEIPKENIKENIKENNNNECCSFTDVQELSTPKENTPDGVVNNKYECTMNDELEVFLNKEIKCEYNTLIYNEIECIYENLNDINTNQLSITELIEIHGTDKDMIKSNPYVKDFITNEMLSIIDYSTNNEKHQESIMNWINKNDYLIYYFYNDLKQNRFDYDFIMNIDKEKRLNVLKSKLVEQSMIMYERDTEPTFVFVDEDNIPFYEKAIYGLV